MCDAPIGTTRWSPAKIKMGWRSWVNGGRGGIVTYLEPFNFAFCETELFEIELCDHWTVYTQMTDF